MRRKKYWVYAILWLLASPVLLLRLVIGVYRRIRFLRVAAIPNISCSCGTIISLLAQWQCGCGYTYRGHLLRVCPVCATLPRMARCFRCGATIKLPEP